MINDSSISYNRDRDGFNGAPLVFVIDGECIYNSLFAEEGVNLFTKNIGISDISSEYPDHDGYTLRIIKENSEPEIFQTSELFGSILLSNPTVVNAAKYPYGHYAVATDASADFDGEKFIIKNLSVSESARLIEWHPNNPYNPNYVAP